MLRVLVLTFSLLAIAPEALAQSNPTLTEAERGIRRDDGGAAAHLRIDTIDVRAHLVGRTADVTVEMLIGSDAATGYEANLALMLPADAVVTGYALDVGGRMIPGQLLEAPKARNVYENEVRAGIDPGLAEVAGNRFTTRIFPIDASHPRRFRLHFVAAFDPAIGLALPLARDASVRRVTVGVTADGYAAAPAVRFAGQPLDVRRRDNGWGGEAVLTNAAIREGLTITGGASAGPMIVARHSSGQPFFLIDDGADSGSKPPSRRGRLRVYWDRSLSHRADRTDLEAEVLARLAERTRPVAIDLVTFASDRPQVATLGTAAALRAALANVTYRGGTSLAGLESLALPEATDCVLVFDGKVTIDRAATFAPDCRLVALTSAAGADAARLGRLTQSSGGSVVRLTPGGEAAALAALAPRQVVPVSVRDATGRRIDARTLPAGADRWLLVGPMPTGGVTVRLSDGSERRYTQAGVAVVAQAPAALWAAGRVAALADDPAQHVAMAETARRYQVAGPGMSFLVLERPDQYLRADLTPPGDFTPEWMAGYRDAKRDWDKEHRDARQERLAFVVEQWEQRRTWWARRFTPRTGLPTKRGRGGDADMVAVPPPPPPPPAPSPAIMAEPSQSESLARLPGVAMSPSIVATDSNIVVTAARGRDVLPSAQQPAQAEIKLDMADLIARRPYIAALDLAGPDKRLAVLAEQERQYGSVPTFYLDVAEWFRSKDDLATASLLLLSALELPTSDDETRQIVAFRLERDRSLDRAVELAEHLAAANAEFRPQPGRDLALALAARGRAAGKAGRADLERAFRLLVDTALDPASSNFDGIEVIALMEANALVPLIESVGGQWTLDKRLVGLTDTDARIVIEWTADDADIDLWVDEPNGERVMYLNKLSSAGGQISNDMTDGYGPEEYAIRHAPAGSYNVRVNGYDADRINPNGPGHVLIRLQRNFARPGQAQELVDLDLSYQTGRSRNAEGRTRSVATLRVER